MLEWPGGRRAAWSTGPNHSDCARRARRSPPTTPPRRQRSRPDRIVLTASTSEAYSLLFKCCAIRARRSWCRGPAIRCSITSPASTPSAPGSTISNITAAGRSISRRSSARCRLPTRAIVDGLAEQPDRIAHHASTSSSGSTRLRRSTARPSSPTKCSSITSWRRRRRAGSPLRAGSSLVFSLGRAVEVDRSAASQACVDRRGRAVGAGR